MQTQTLRQALELALCDNPWARRWFAGGPVLCAACGKVFEAKRLDVAAPGDLEALGCGGWTPQGRVNWVGLDLDVGHGSSPCDSPAAALKHATRVRSFVRGAAEVRCSKSGQGIHVRVALAAGVNGGREQAACLAKWLACTLALRADASPLGRQDFWFWAKQPAPHAFELITPCEGWWMPPPQAAKDAVIVIGRRPPVLGLATHCALSRRTREFLNQGAPVGQRNYRLFIAACDFAGVGFSEEQAAAELVPVAAGVGIPDREAHATIRSAYNKPRSPATHASSTPPPQASPRSDHANNWPCDSTRRTP